MLRDEEKLATTLFNIAEYREAMEVSMTDLTHRLRTSLNYFLGVLVILLSLIVLMLGYIVPAFEEILAVLRGNLPSITQSLIMLSRGFVAYWWLISSGMLLLGVGLWVQRKRVILHVPLIGHLYRKIAIVHFLRTCAFMLSHDATLVQALQASAQAVNNPRYAKSLQQLSEQVANGAVLSNALLKQHVFPTKVVHAARIGTQTHQLDKLFMKLAEVYTKQLYQAVAPTVKSLEVLATMILGFLVGWFVLAMYSPFFSMCEAI